MWFYGPLPLGASVVQSTVLGGSGITPQQGTAKADRSVPLTTSAVTCSAGTLVANHTKALTTTNDEGTQTCIVSARGNVGATQTIDTVAIFGEASTSGIGSVGVSFSKALTGEASTSGIGSLGVGSTPVLTLMSAIAGGTGTVVASGLDVTVNLNAGEIEMEAFTGSVRPSAVLSGTAITGALNSFATVENTPTDTLLGMQFTASTGTMAANQDVEDTYISSNSGVATANPQVALDATTLTMTGSQGNVAATEDTTLALVGEPSTVSAGDVGFSNEIPILGEQILGEQYFVGAPGYGFPEGIECIVSAGDVRDFTGEDRDFPLFGEGITVSIDTALIVDQLIQLFNGNIQITSEQYLYNVDAELEGIQIDMSQGLIGAGDKMKDAGGKKKDKKRKKVTIDGQTFEVDEDELKDLIKVVEEVATAKAKEEAAEAVAALVAAKSTDKVRLKTPKVTGDEELKDKLADIYAQAAIDAQVALEVSRNRQLDEEEAIVLLLVN